MSGYLSIILHAHLPFVRHPEHENFLEESWLFEAITETYLPLLQVMNGWQRDNMDARITMTLSPTLCAMLRDPLLQSRYARHLDELIILADKEVSRTHWEPEFQELAKMYHTRLTTAATHGLLPLMANHPPSVRAQILIARDHYRDCFGCDPRGIWLPECAYFDGVETYLQEANIRWFIVDSHGLLHAKPRPRYGVFAPVFTPNGIAVFGRDMESSRQVWSRTEGYPGDARYRDFYRDIGFDLDFDYVKPHLPSPENRGFTGIKYHRITGGSAPKQPYQPAAAREAVDAHATHFLKSRVEQITELSTIVDRPPLIISPYDAELFGHWWYEGPEFLDLFVRKAYFDQKVFEMITPEQYLRRHPTNQIATPAASSWGEEGYYRVWLNEKNEWIYRHLQIAQERMTEMVRKFAKPTALQERALKQAARELLLAQSSDWPFILRTNTSPDYAKKRVKAHLLRFNGIYHQLTTKKLNDKWLAEIETRDNLFSEINVNYWA